MTILLVDDVYSNLEVYTQILRRIEGAKKFVTFTSSAGALEWAKDFDPDVVLVDYNMPAPDGLDFVERFRQLPGKGLTPILMITAARERNLRRRAFKLGVNDFITNPIDPAELSARVSNMLTLRQCHQGAKA
jgi:CheY-like chemotaxis protein